MSVKNISKKESKIESSQSKIGKITYSGQLSKTFSKAPKNNKQKMEKSMKNLEHFEKVKLNKEMEVLKELVRLKRKVKEKINEKMFKMMKMG